MDCLRIGLAARVAPQAAFCTRPERMQSVHTRICLRTPLITARTRRRFGFQRRRRVLFAWLITFPKCGPLPQSSHFIAIFTPEWEITPGRSIESIRETPEPEIGLRVWALKCGIRIRMIDAA